MAFPEGLMNAGPGTLPLFHTLQAALLLDAPARVEIEPQGGKITEHKGRASVSFRPGWAPC